MFRQTNCPSPLLVTPLVWVMSWCFNKNSSPTRIYKITQSRLVWMQYKRKRSPAEEYLQKVNLCSYVPCACSLPRTNVGVRALYVYATFSYCTRKPTPLRHLRGSRVEYNIDIEYNTNISRDLFTHTRSHNRLVEPYAWPLWLVIYIVSMCVCVCARRL